MVNETISSLRPRVIGEVTSASKKHGRWMYVRMPDAWITLAPAHPLEMAKRADRGQVYLRRYGVFQYDPFEMDVNGQLWNVRKEPYRMLFQKGGEKEFPLDQIIAFRWHLRPPYQEVTFPQLAGVYWEVYECPDCAQAVFTSLEKDSAPQEMISHLRLGHGWSRAEVAEYAREVGIEFRRTKKSHTPASLETKQLDVAPAEPEKNEEFRCDCGWAPPKDAKRPDVSLRWHKKNCEVAPAGGVPKEE